MGECDLRIFMPSLLTSIIVEDGADGFFNREISLKSCVNFSRMSSCGKLV